MEFDFSKVAGNITKVKFPNGIVGKVSLVLVVLIFMSIWGITKIGNELLSAVTILIVIIIVFITLLRLIRFADKNPQAALFEGAELLYHEQMQLASKEKGSISFNPNMQHLGTPISENSEESTSAEIPDSE